LFFEAFVFDFFAFELVAFVVLVLVLIFGVDFGFGNNANLDVSTSGVD
jgi:hypothetical protein